MTWWAHLREASARGQNVSVRYRKLFVLVFIFPSVLCTWDMPPIQAQTRSAVDGIQATISRIDLAIQDGNDSEQPRFHSIELNSMLPGSGPQTTSIRMYYSEYQISPDSWELMQSLIKVVVRGNISAVQFLKEFYFQDGRLLFHAATPDTSTVCGSVRLYVDRSMPVAVEWTSKNDPCVKTHVNVSRAQALPKEMQLFAATARKDAAVLLRLFGNLVSINNRMVEN